MGPQKPSDRWAHSHPEKPIHEWQSIIAHLEGVARRAEQFATPFLAKQIARILSLLHDIGKYAEKFQARLRASAEAANEDQANPEKVDHSTAGAQFIYEMLGQVGALLAYIIAGHHCGLPDAEELRGRLTKEIEEWKSFAPDSIKNVTVKVTTPPWFIKGEFEEVGFQWAFYLRMLFSALVDADYLDTEEFMSPQRYQARQQTWPSMAELSGQLQSYMAATFGQPKTKVHRQREIVRRNCLEAAPSGPGFFSLTVPVGGAKTLSSLGFALEHAARHGLKRVIYVIPFTSIIEQNADVFREALGRHSHCVIEHHSNLDPEGPKSTYLGRLAAENWDAPVVVTTNVQFYESLFANKPSRCRKLHNISEAVIIIDEAQSIPVDYLRPTLAALNELVRGYRSTIVLCTATQPAIEKRSGFPIGIPSPRRICSNEQALFQALKRVEVRHIGKKTNAEIAEALHEQPQALAIVNTRAHAAQLFSQAQLLGPTTHLSALMCPAHRSEILAEVKERLRQKQPVRLVSTQLIEAGVDISFPTLYRAETGIDSIAQSAGRCNREGEIAKGYVYLFEPEQPAPKAFQRAISITKDEVLKLYPHDPLSREAIEHYFRLYFWHNTKRWDHHHIMNCFVGIASKIPALNFRTCAENFNIIGSDMVPVLIPHGPKARKLIDELAATHANGELPFMAHRRAQRFVVQVYRKQFEANLGVNITTFHESFHVLSNPRLYNGDTGLCLDSQPNPEDLIV